MANAKADELVLKLSEVEIAFINEKAAQYSCSPQGYIEGLLLERIKGEKILKPGESPELQILSNYLANNAHDGVAREMHHVLKHFLKGERIPKQRVQEARSVVQPQQSYARVKPGE